jgi:hypothetical protein
MDRLHRLLVGNDPSADERVLAAMLAAAIGGAGSPLVGDLGDARAGDTIPGLAGTTFSKNCSPVEDVYRIHGPFVDIGLELAPNETFNFKFSDAYKKSEDFFCSSNRFAFEVWHDEGGTAYYQGDQIHSFGFNMIEDQDAGTGFTIVAGENGVFIRYILLSCVSSQ